MNTPTSLTRNRIHPVMMAAAASVTLVSLLGVAALTGILPSSHSTVAPITPAAPIASTAPVSSPAATPSAVAVADPSNVNAPTRYVTADGKVLEVVPHAVQATSVTQYDPATARSTSPAPATHRRVVHHTTQHYAQNTYSQPVTTYQQPYYAPQQQHPVVNYVNDMHPVGTGVGAVVGGLLGNQVGGGNGKKLATVAGVLMGGYAGNEIAHNRSPLPGQ